MVLNLRRKPFKIDIVIPVYNEADNVKTVLRSILDTLEGENAFSFQILIVNDGSTDDSTLLITEFLRERPCKKIPILLLENDINIGTARTMLRLFKVAVSNHPDMVIKLDMDYDFSHEEVLLKFFNRIQSVSFCPISTILVGIRIIPSEKKMTFYEQARKRRTDEILIDKFGLENYDPVSGGTQLYPLPILEEIINIDIVKTYNLRWGVDVLLPLLARKTGFQLETIPIYNSRYSFDRRSDLKVKSQYDAFTAVFELIHSS
ncbi:MAG: glycosyltransferase family 2 protein [Saprospiraceae bacterium]